MHQQEQCVLFRLPIELREIIYTLALTAKTPITDPTIGPLIRSPYTSVSSLGAALPRTCRRINTEADADILYLNNTLRFTSPRIASAFLRRLPPKHHHLFKGIVCDLRTLNVLHDYTSGGAEPYSEWIHYLHCTRNQHGRLGACRRYDEVLQLDIPPQQLKWVGFDITALQQQLGVLQKVPELVADVMLEAYAAKVRSLLALLRRLSNTIIASHRHWSGMRDETRLEALRVFASDHEEKVVERCMDPRTDDLEIFLEGLLDTKTGRLARLEAST